MATIITYDVPSRHVDLKNAMFALGYADKFVSEGKYVYLPNTTLHHGSRTPVEAREELRTVCAKLGIKLERCIAVEMANWAAIFGEPFK